ncbi:hypothetical protein PG991_003225 [Apiospora marii]|uniref:ATPase AAA-type core domain-containing protein n=1 Tax=Apiospora marii TaxID=335849 RepID=A0ABR1SHP0_9PEZI
MQDDAGEGVSPSGIYHEVEFDDLAWNRLHRQPWSKPFDPTEARKGADDDRTETERVRVKKAGFLRNPDVEISSFFQVLTIESKQLIAALRALLAKCIAELIGRPLLSLTCADLGTDEQSMEHSLSKWFKLAEQWGAVMLLDEADIWLERRMVSDLKRNTLVAVFLRCLEYYRGILFLTSNRVGTFDDAFISRIHVVIHYEDLEEPQRKQIWKQFFDKLERERKDSIIVESRAKHFVLNDSEMRKLPWNGREIRNAFQTAVSLAEYRFYFEGGKDESDKIVLDKMDFEQVCQMSLEFKKYLTQVHSGDDENDRAMRQRARA